MRLVRTAVANTILGITQPAAIESQPAARTNGHRASGTDPWLVAGPPAAGAVLLAAGAPLWWRRRRRAGSTAEPDHNSDDGPELAGVASGDRAAASD